ncbi:ArnT family glycosyltransferase [Vibrio salinus]|uniref:ArnT family glycosyltransferase n=1 Tax=Vibrio salinus TaxID=2899784 RepID=UPI001E58C071|nr:glycosyltransferase family 39 protein [Vibrio salinus]MCE0494241.1 glycosyltransferase family 39 protein [Vibrio salinus]
MNITKTHLWVLLAFALLIRLISLATYPLMDSTEARYGEMARLMVETHNWLTPQFDYGIPFWGKPPMFTWMSAYGIELFGLNEFAVRAPHWLAGVVTIILTAFMAKRAGFSALIAALVLATCGIFSIAAGAVMTDMALTLAMTIAMMGFYYCWSGKDKYCRLWGYLSFFGLASGLLAKGPVALVIMGIAVFPWLVIQHGFINAFKVLWQRFPIVSGVALMLAIALPWYIMAERATPGFIDYFIVGEHFKRYIISGWKGDLYGSAHVHTRGMIWLFWLYSAAPWSIVLPVIAWKRRNLLKTLEPDHKKLFSYLLCWLISPMILFTLAGNILPAYVLPGVPAIGILIAMLVDKHDFRWVTGVAALVPVLLMIAMLVMNMGRADRRSDRVIFEHITDNAPVFYVGHRPFSGQFYSRGKAKQLKNNNELNHLSRFHLIGKEAEVYALIHAQSLSCTYEFTAKSKRSLYTCLAR